MTITVEGTSKSRRHPHVTPAHEVEAAEQRPPLLVIPPPPEALDHIEEHPYDDRLRLRIEFYKAKDGSYFVWPYVRDVYGDCDAMRHFVVEEHFATIDEARIETLLEGRELIVAGFDVHAMS